MELLDENEPRRDERDDAKNEDNRKRNLFLGIVLVIFFLLCVRSGGFRFHYGWKPHFNTTRTEERVVTGPVLVDNPAGEGQILAPDSTVTDTIRIEH